MFALLFGGLTAFLRTSLIALFGSWKAVLVTTMLTFAGITLYNVYTEMLQIFTNYALGIYGTAQTPQGAQTLYQFTGLLGYFMNCFKIPECMSFIMAIITMKFLMRKIPFIKW